MLKNGKCDSKHKSVSFLFLFYINKIHLAGPKYSIIPGLWGLDRKNYLQLIVI
jgi:hypothetical protein